MTYPSVPSQPDLPALEREVLDRWEREDTFQRSVEAREAGTDGENEFVFYDGPPFANGLPHYGHLLTGYVKDAIPRYRTMRGQHVERRFGWDCHGLPAEVQAEKELGISGHPEIAAFGVERFNDACRTSVLQYTHQWQDYVTRQARWVDFDNDYKTLDLDYMESVMWAFKTLWDKGLIYEGYRVLAYCWRCETPLSNTETRMDDVYRDRQDPAVTVWFELDSGERILAWTTTPWTLPSNMALAVGPDIDYVTIEAEGHRWILAESRLAAYEQQFPEAVVIERTSGKDLVGRSYGPLFNYFADAENAFQVLAGDFVSTEDGTGVVHMAPGFGEEDQNLCAEAGIATVCPMDEHGRYTSEVADWVGQHVFEANPAVIRSLRDSGRLVRHDSYVHSYPHCWRCAEPLVYRAISSWFVKVTSFRDRMVELNADINWVPSHVKEGSFGKWIANARDWSISRNRFWGSPIPVWQSDDPTYPRTDVYGSIADLAADFGVTVTDLHRPAIDDLVRPNPDDPTGKSMMRRVPEVLDCWFESGSMPFAQVHYPFENAEWFEHHYPGDFIVEYIGQTRGWFYTMHVLATALFDRPAFSNCVSHGIVLGDDGAKMSKSLRNYPDPNQMFDVHGSDAMRWYLLSSPILRGADFSVTETGMRDTVRQVILPLWNAYYFLTLYAGAADKTGAVTTEFDDVLDRYLMGELHELVAGVTVSMEAYDLFAAAEQIQRFLDTLTNWYIRRSRDRFWAGEQDAINALHTALVILCRVAAPLLPMVADHIHTGLTGGQSVHLEDWPEADTLTVDSALKQGMDRVRDACSTVLSLRKAEGLRVRLPLASVVLATPDIDVVKPHLDILRDEVNVKSVILTEDVAAHGTEELVLAPKALGPRLGASTQRVIAAHKAGDWSVVDGTVTVGGEVLEDGEYEFRLVSRSGEGAAATLPRKGGIVVLDTVITAELATEGQARDLIRRIQNARRESGLAVSDRVRLELVGDLETIEAFEAHREMVLSETLTIETEISVGESEQLLVTAVA